MSDERVTLARAELSGLCDGSRKFTMSIPPRMDRDSDMLISAGLDAADEALAAAAALRLSLAQAQAREAKMREALAKLPSRHAFVLPLPADNGALREFGERCVLAGRKDAMDEMGAWDAGVARPHQEPSAIVARVIGGAA